MYIIKFLIQGSYDLIYLLNRLTAKPLILWKVRRGVLFKFKAVKSHSKTKRLVLENKGTTRIGYSDRCAVNYGNGRWAVATIKADLLVSDGTCRAQMHNQEDQRGRGLQMHNQEDQRGRGLLDGWETLVRLCVPITVTSIVARICVPPKHNTTANGTGDGD